MDIRSRELSSVGRDIA